MGDPSVMGRDGLSSSELYFSRLSPSLGPYSSIGLPDTSSKLYCGGDGGWGDSAGAGVSMWSGGTPTLSSLSLGKSLPSSLS
jgi:hypothetical protein